MLTTEKMTLQKQLKIWNIVWNLSLVFTILFGFLTVILASYFSFEDEWSWEWTKDYESLNEKERKYVDKKYGKGETKC
jgi:hypothetical protein